MENFIAVVCNEVKEPKNWSDIYEGYQKLSGENRSIFLLNSLKEISYTENKCFLIQVLAIELARFYNADLAIELNKLQPRFKFHNTPQLGTELTTTISLTKSALLKLEEKKQAIKNMAKVEAPTRSDWDINFLQISKFLGTRLTPKNTTISEYCASLQLIKQSNKPEKKWQNRT